MHFYIASRVDEALDGNICQMFSTFLKNLLSDFPILLIASYYSI